MKQRLACRVSTLLVPLLAASLHVSAAAQEKSRLLTRSDIQAAIGQPRLEAARTSLEMALSQDQADWVAAEAIAMDPGLGDVGREFLLYGTLMRARTMTPDSKALDFVGRLQSYESTVYVNHEEGPLPVAVYPIAAMASGTLGAWQRQDARRLAAEAFAAGNMSPMQHLADHGSHSRAGVLAALREADGVAIEQAAEWLDARSAGGGFYEARAITALRRRDAGEVIELLSTGDSAGTMRLLRSVRTHFDADTAFDVLQRATGNTAMASAALFEMDALRQAGPGSRIDAYLLDALDDPVNGATAAAIIGQRADPVLLEGVRDRLYAPGASRERQARAVLALTLAGNQFARSTLRQAAESAVISDSHLHEEVVQWLQN